MTAPTTAIVGLGNMGLAVAGRLRTQGPVLGHDASPERRALAAAAGVDIVELLVDVAKAPVVVLCLPSPQISHTVAEELVPHLAEGTLVVETSTVNPADMETLAQLLLPAGARCIDAAILTGVLSMEDGTAALLTGGSEADISAAAPVLDAMSNRRTHFGELGAGMAAKVINNAVAHAVMVLLAEAAAMGAASGIRVEQIVEMLRDPGAGLIRPLTFRLGDLVARGDYAPGMPTDAARKDSVLAIEFAQQAGVPLFAIQAAHTVYEIAVGRGLGRQDYAAVATLWEEWTGRPLSAGTGAADPPRSKEAGGNLDV